VTVLAATPFHCYNASKLMADWKQITARIRRARTGKDPAGQLSNLFEKTRDAMVAFELAKYFETAGLSGDAAKWYATAAERFRRADWKSKAQEAAVRLGAEMPVVTPSEGLLEGAVPRATEPRDNSPAVAPSEPALRIDRYSQSSEPISVVEEDGPAEPIEVPEQALTALQTSTAASPPDDPKRRRRGRRGGRNRRRVVPASDTTTERASETATSRRSPPPHRSEDSGEPHPPQMTPSRMVHSHAMPQLPLEPAAEGGASSVKGRYGDPGLSSRISLLEMQFRRLLTCTPVKLSEADHAPVGPGVFVLTDSDLTTYYYVEACQTLRIAVGNLLRGGSSRRGSDSLKPQLAEHLGIAESRVPKYLADHCVVRWLQLDEGASHFAHFVIAVLRPTLNE
jgi:hypothetical protein